MSRKSTLATLGVATAAAGTMMALASPAMAATLNATSTNLTVSVNGSNVATCTSSVLTGTDNGATGSITGATATGCGVTVTTANLPWAISKSGSTETITNFTMKAAGCTFAGNLSGTVSGSNLTITNQAVTGTGTFCLFKTGVKVSATYTPWT